MKKILFGIFAHPDDEAFGPLGTLLQEARSDTEVHLILLTAGDAGVNPTGELDLGKVRLAEWKAASKLLGATSTQFLGYNDGQLCNNQMVEITERIMEGIKKVTATTPGDAEIELLTFDFTGLSGHIDHIVAARATCLAFFKLKETEKRLTRLRLLCLPASFFPADRTEWLYAEKGCSEEEIDEIVDARELQDDIIKIMRTHKTQQADCDKLLALYGDQLGLNYFIVKT